MDKQTAECLNDLLDVIEEVTKIVSETNPGANYGFIEFLIRRIEQKIDVVLEPEKSPS